MTPDVRRVVEFDYSPSKTPRYYQLNAIHRSVEAIANGQNRVLLVMATGTRKTYTAFQIIWRLWKSKAKKRILFLADRNILIDQTMVNDFSPFKGAMAKLSPSAKGVERVDAQGQVTVEHLPLAVNKATKEVNKNFESYLSLYQAVSGTEEEQNIYKQFSPGFFDLIVVDECHCGSADEDSAWREILTYFSGATQVGLTATPKETKDISNSDYFGAPLYTDSLKQGVEDGYLAPYKVVRVDLGVVAKTAKSTGLESITVGGIKIDTSKIGRVDGTTLTNALRALVEAANNPVALIIDEAQHALTSTAGETAMAALKSARDQLNRPGQTQLMLVMLGSDRDKLLRLVNTNAAPFYGSQIQRMPELGPDFVAHIAELIVRQRPDLAPVNQTILSEAFALFSQRPQFFMEALGQVLSPLASHTGRFEDALLTQATAQLGKDEAQMESNYTALKPLEQAVLWRMLALAACRA